MSRASLGVLSASLFIAACSGSVDEFGGAGPDGGTFDVTTANGLTATKIAWESAIASSQLTDLGGAIGGTPVAAATSKSTLIRPAQLAVGSTQVDPFGPFVEPCQTGSVTISGERADLFTLTVDDTFTVLYEMCDEGLGEVVDGQIDFTVNDFSGDLMGGTYLLSMDAIVTNLQVMTGTDTLTSNGDATVGLDTSASPYVEASSSGSSMTTDSNNSSETLFNYRSNQTVDGNEQNQPYTMFASGTLSSTQLNGNIAYVTPVEFSGEGTDYPSSGVLLVEGENSSARLTAVDSVNVTIELDVNGDGETDHTIEATWADLAS